MKALVIGGNRFFGKGLVKALLEEGVDVTLLNRGQTLDEFGTDVERIIADRNNLKMIPQLKNNVWDIVYDQVCYDAAQAEAACDVFRDQTEHYVFTSTASVYKNGKANLVESDFDPETYLFDKFVTSSEDYGEAKRQAEATFVKHASFPLSMIRFPIVMGEEDYTDRLKFHVDHIVQSKAIFIPNLAAKMSFVHADDAADFLAELMDVEAVGAMNVASEYPISLQELILQIEQLAQKKALLSAEGEKSPYGVPNDWYLNTSKLQDFEFQTMPIEQWLPDLIESQL